MPRRIFFLKRAGAGAMVHSLRCLVHLLQQRATKCHIEFLDAATDRQHRHATSDRFGDQPQRRGVAFQVVVFGRQAFAAIVM